VLIGTSAIGRDTVEVTVRDSGEAIAPENAGRVFDAYFTTKPDGMGMGLAIARSIVEAHGGRIWTTTNEDHGSTFRLTLPIVPNGKGSNDS
jgi:signal transduction histidine kinase